jgi:hypothetical protein
MTTRILYYTLPIIIENTNTIVNNLVPLFADRNCTIKIGYLEDYYVSNKRIETTDQPNPITYIPDYKTKKVVLTNEKAFVVSYIANSLDDIYCKISYKRNMPNLNSVYRRIIRNDLVNSTTYGALVCKFN